jgi:alcohol dehydrogenase class IV
MVSHARRTILAPPRFKWVAIIVNNSKVYLYEGALAELQGILAQLAASRVLFVVDQPAYRASGAAKLLEPALAGTTVTRFSDFGPNPKLGEIERGIAIQREAAADVVIALGGGTAIDLAKSIARLTAQAALPRDVITGGSALHPNGPPLIAIPTTSGTGSEATHFAVVYVDHVKYSLAHESLLPEIAIIDPCLTYSLPVEVTRASGLDALCQSVESLWSVGATTESLHHASQSLALVLTHLTNAVQNPTPECRRGLSEAAHLAGKAINISKTTAPHALSYAFTAHYGVPHGIAAALTLSPFLRYNAQVSAADCTDPRGADHVLQRIDQITRLFEGSDIESVCQRLDEIIEQVGGLTRLAQIGAQSDEAIEQLTPHINLERLANNPRAVDARALNRLLKSIR